MSKRLAVTLGIVTALGVGISPLARAEAPETARPAGPCYLHLLCDNGGSVSCTGQVQCDYQTDAPGHPGWVRCDGAGYSCGGDSW